VFIICSLFLLHLRCFFQVPNCFFISLPSLLFLLSWKTLLGGGWVSDFADKFSYIDCLAVWCVLKRFQEHDSSAPEIRSSKIIRICGSREV
jgi:hypothetical protein